jgi:hypothetical protein
LRLSVNSVFLPQPALQPTSADAQSDSEPNRCEAEALSDDGSS